jgi:cell wall-associated NlpC family hydrolase
MTVVPKGSTRSTDPREPSSPALADVDASTLTFVGRHAEITVRVASCKLERAIEGASSLTVVIHDPEFKFLRSAAIQGPPRKSRLGKNLAGTVVIDNQVFVVTGLHLQAGHMVEVTLEDETVWRLRQFNKPLVMSRGKVTRAEFIKHMFDEAGVELICPELDKKQPIESTAEAEKAAQKNRKRKPGFSAHAKLTVKKQPADSEQRHNIETALDVAASHHSGEPAAAALLVSIIQESLARSNNILQLEPGNLTGDHVSATDVAGQCAIFLAKGFTGKGGAIALANAHPGWTPGEIAIAVQGPRNKDPGVYQVWAEEAKAMIALYSGNDAEALQPGRTFAKEYQFRRGGPNGELETSWDCARRLAEEVKWYLFVESGTGFFFSPEQLLWSRARMLVAPGADGLIGHPTGGQMTSPRYDDTLNVSCHAAKWGAPPGTIAELDEYGLLDGAWVVTGINRENMTSSVTAITLGRPQHKKKEPAHELGHVPASQAAQGGRGTAVAAYEAAQELSGFKQPYLWGGGHNAHELAKVANGGTKGLDCSGSVSWVLWKCGMRESDTAETSGALASNFGEKGEGKYMTVWANSDHTFIEFKIPGKPHSRLDTVSPGDVGARLQPFSPLPEGSTKNFTPRRFPGQ